ncbi:RagB/SusD family nutrient uptake outer membrane protein [Phocaeicola sp.]
MKNILNKFVFGGLCVATLIGVTACDPLGVEPTTKVDQDRFWLNPQLSRSYVNNFYLWSPAGSGHNFQSEQWTDNCQGNKETDWNTYRQYAFNNRRYDESASSPEGFSAPWSNSFQHIRAVNLGIERISTSTSLTEAIKNQLMAECYFFRAQEYFELEKYWGTVPYVDRSLTINDDTFIPRIKREQLFDNILADLTEALKYFELFGGTPSIGMVNTNVVNSFISRVALYAANAAEASSKGLYSDALFTFEKNAAHYYEISYNAAMKVVGKYALETNYEDLFTSNEAHISVESIWPVMFDLSKRSGFNPTEKNGPDGYYYGANEQSKSWEFRSGIFPTQDLVDCYLQKDAVDGKWKKWWETSQSQALNTKMENGKIIGEGADYRNIYKDRDARFYATVTYDGAYMGPENEMYIIQTWIDNSDKDPEVSRSLQYSALHTGYKNVTNINSTPGARGSSQTITGYYSRKYSQFNKYSDDGTINKEQRKTCYFNIRYAEVLLNAAEAGVKLGKSDAEGYVNQIRNRAGLSNFSAAEAGHDLFEEIKIQRRLEFAFECPGFRYFDLLRWNEAEGKSVIEELNKASRGIHIFRKGIESNKMGENGYPAAPNDEKYFTPYFETFTVTDEIYERKFDNARYYFMPFSLSMLDSYPGLTQNPGWSDFKYNY